jgi:hypothetical protein
MKIYVAGSSSEKALIIPLMQNLRDHGLTISHDWTVSEPGFGGHDAELTKEKRLQYAKNDLQKGVAEADLFWLVCPDDVKAPVMVSAGSVSVESYLPRYFTPSRGCWTELGYALCLRDINTPPDPDARFEDPFPIIISGASAQRSIFTELASESFESHGDAFRWIVDYAQRKKEGGR